MRFLRRYWLDAVALAVAIVVFVVPFGFIFLTAVKDRAQSAALDLSWPTSWHVRENLTEVFTARNNMLQTATRNSLFVTIASVTIVVIACSMVGFVLERRRDRMSKVVNAFVLSGLIIPPAVVPTIYVLQEINLFNTLWGLILVEVAFTAPFAIILFRAFVATIPRELDEAAMIDGCTSFTLYRRVVFPLLRPVIITVIVTASVAIYNDFVNPLYFLPGSDNPTVQLTLYNFQSQFNTRWNLLFMDVLLITIPPLIMFILFNRKIVAGLTAGAIKG
ncbi:MAG TPA: carbohydrate ABC transporter permease [Ilumatobacteraceae bacterium]|nr:carbohydrate ABC transporter permease [Ilumatobacteraceae bacterium]